MYRSCTCKCPVEQSACRCSSNESHSSSEDVCPGEPYSGQCSCCPCDKPMVRGKFGLAYVIETPKKKFCKPLGWQVEFEDTPSKIVNNCQKMMKWVNCPPLGDCNNIETNFCAYPEDCGQLLKERRNRPPKCCCISKSTKKDKDARTCCPREPKKKCKNQPCYNQNPEQVCIICDNCKVNAPGCCNPPKVLCCSKTSRKPPCKCQDRNDTRCKCYPKEDTLEKCCKCCRPKLNTTFFRESLDIKYSDQYEHGQCCCAKKFCICDDLLDYIPKKDTERNRHSEEKTNDRVTPYKDKERSMSPKTEVREKPRTNVYKIEHKPVLKENKETKTDDRELRVGKSPVGETNKKEPIEVQAKPAQSTNLIDELQERLKERKEKEVAPKNIKQEENNKKNTTEVAPVKNKEETKAISKVPSKNEISESQTKNIKNEESVRKNTNEMASEKNEKEEKANIEEEKNIPKAPSEDETPKAVEEDQVKVPDNLSLGSKGESIQSVKSRDISSQPSILQKIKEAHKRQQNELHPPKVPSIEENEPKVDSGKSTNNPSNPISEHKTEEEIKKTDYDITSKTILEKIKEAHQRQVHEIHPEA